MIGQMRHLRRAAGLLAAATCLLAANANAQQEKLKVGDTAPGLEIEAWVAGTETAIESGHVYVVEFWATWCAPCKKSIPHLSELQEEYADEVTFIGVSDEAVSTVKPFVNRMRDQMRYTVAVDKQKATGRAWMEAAGQNGIPCAFVVDRNRTVQWIGNPLDPTFDRVLRQVVDGRYNSKAFGQWQPTIDAAARARSSKNFRLAMQHYQTVLEADPKVFGFLALDMFDMLLLDMDDPMAAYALVGKVVADWSDDARLLSDFAQKIVSDPKIPTEKRNLDVAFKAIETALPAMRSDDPNRFAIPARINYFAGNFDQAVDLQRQAWRMAKPASKEKMRRDLETYQSAMRRSEGVGK